MLLLGSVQMKRHKNGLSDCKHICEVRMFIGAELARLQTVDPYSQLTPAEETVESQASQRCVKLHVWSSLAQVFLSYQPVINHHRSS